MHLKIRISHTVDVRKNKKFTPPHQLHSLRRFIGKVLFASPRPARDMAHIPSHVNTCIVQSKYSSGIGSSFVQK